MNDFFKEIFTMNLIYFAHHAMEEPKKSNLNQS